MPKCANLERAVVCGGLGLGLVAVVLPRLGLGVLGPGGRRAVGGELLVADLKNQE